MITWSAVQITEIGTPTFKASSVLPSDWAPSTSVFEGELYALIWAAEHALHHCIYVYVDNAAVVKGAQRSPQQ
eukprot:5737970-Amphidinium_carterae.1